MDIDDSPPAPRRASPPEIAAEASNAAVRQPPEEDFWSRPAPRRSTGEVSSPPRDRWPIIAAIIAIVMGAAALIAMGEKIVRILPPAAVGYRALGLPVNLAGLELRGVRSRIEMDGARKVLITEGEIANIRQDENRVPPLTLAVRDARGLQRYAWTAPSPKTRLQPGETIAFRARLASPPEDGADVLVRFARMDEARPSK